MTVLLFTWFCYTNENPGIIFVAMNYSVHAIMYGYYYLMAVGAKPKWLKPQVHRKSHADLPSIDRSIDRFPRFSPTLRTPPRHTITHAKTNSSSP